MTEELKEFDKWWDENEKQFTEDSMHMSQYHMASVVWQAARQSNHSEAVPNTSTLAEALEALAWADGHLNSELIKRAIGNIQNALAKPESEGK